LHRQTEIQRRRVQQDALEDVLVTPQVDMSHRFGFIQMAAAESAGPCCGAFCRARFSNSATDLSRLDITQYDLLPLAKKRNTLRC
jgi:hypothetical protein